MSETLNEMSCEKKDRVSLRSCPNAATQGATPPAETDQGPTSALPAETDQGPAHPFEVANEPNGKEAKLRMSNGNKIQFEAPE